MGDTLRALPETPRISQHYGIERFKGAGKASYNAEGIFVFLVCVGANPTPPYPINAERCVQHLLSERLRLSA